MTTIPIDFLLPISFEKLIKKMTSIEELPTSKEYLEASLRFRHA
jgi:hypothetical protein